MYRHDISFSFYEIFGSDVRITIYNLSSTEYTDSTFRAAFNNKDVPCTGFTAEREAMEYGYAIICYVHVTTSRYIPYTRYYRSSDSYPSIETNEYYHNSYYYTVTNFKDVVTTFTA